MLDIGNPGNKVSGDDTWQNAEGINLFPVGTLVIRETAAPEGYLISDEVLTVTIEEGEGRTLKHTLYADGVQIISAPVTLDQTADFNYAFKEKEKAKPSIHSAAADLYTGSGAGTVHPDGTFVIVDTLSYANVTAGKTYYAVGKLYDRDTGEDTGITGTAVFTAGAEEGTVQNTFTFAGEEGKTYVCFERLYVDEVIEQNLVAVDEDIRNEAQTVRYPEIRTCARDGRTCSHIGTIGETAVVDTVFFENLAPGETYRIDGILMDKLTGEPLLADGETVTASSGEFTAEETEGAVEIVFTLDASALENTTAVAFEKLFHRDSETGEMTEVHRHEDITDEDQSVHFPRIRTIASDRLTGTGAGTIIGGPVNALTGRAEDEKAVIIDTVKYENLVPGMTCEFYGTLMDKDTGRAAAVCDNPVTLLVTEPDGEVTLSFTVDTAELAMAGNGAVLVAFEKLFHGIDNAVDEAGNVDPEKRVEIARHEDLEDEDQSVYAVSMRTSAADCATGDQVGVISREAAIRDVISFERLAAGCAYTVRGVVKERGTGKTVAENELTFIAGEEAEGVTVEKREGRAVSGTVTLDFAVDSTGLEGRTVVVYEYLLSGDVVITAHPVSDEEIRRQSVYYPAGKTNAVDSRTGAHTADASGTTTVIDRVYFQNLIAGEEYTVKGTLMDKETGEPLDAAGAVSAAAFTAEPDNPALMEVKTAQINGTTVVSGYVDIVFTVSSAALAGKSLVTFERFSHKGVDIFFHEELGDRCQTVKFPKISTEAKISGPDGGSLFDSEGNFGDIVIVDTVKYENLWTQGELDRLAEEGRVIRGGRVESAREGSVYSISEKADYTVTGILMVKETGEPLLNAEGKVCTASAVFTPEEADGSVDVTFVMNGGDFTGADGKSLIAGRTLVVFEDLYLGSGAGEPDGGSGEEPGKADRHIAEHHDLDDEAQTVHVPTPPTPETPPSTPQTPPSTPQTPPPSTPQILGVQSSHTGALLLALAGMAVMLLAFTLIMTRGGERRNRE